MARIGHVIAWRGFEAACVMLAALLLAGGSACAALSSARPALPPGAASSSLPVRVFVPETVIMILDRSLLTFSAEDFLTGEETVEGRTARKPSSIVADVRGNVPFVVSVAADEEMLVSPNGNRIPVSQMKVRRSSSGQFIPLSTQSTQIYESMGPDWVKLPMDFQMDITWQDTADRYGVTIVFTVAKA
ncbi:MAG: hypothetical protein VB144_09560 [Clostridia bacterium]|nr:hypothetical protein [Clostridia bacterium]